MKSDPAALKKAITLRLAGYSLASIAFKTGLSASTLYRQFSKLKVKSGSISAAALDEARNELLNDAGFVNDLKHTIAASIVDDIMVAKRTREAIVLTLDELIDEQSAIKASLADLSLRARALAALATSLSVTQVVQRKALNVDAESYQQVQELPTLTIRKMSDDDVAEIQDRLKAHSAVTED
ncbi:MAG: hypothetical protein PHG00_13330 [Methylococcales bacterium]|nr:hypothetical protein [Methylococcales bacterium]